mmetsp:Transcript_2158/g.4833  ORF Transcript_2158/g.4833 Transcript_2158/m.4833 type:complete len:219 (-) Transcript_2158:79-735(-)
MSQCVSSSSNWRHGDSNEGEIVLEGFIWWDETSLLSKAHSALAVSEFRRHDNGRLTSYFHHSQRVLNARNHLALPQLKRKRFAPGRFRVIKDRPVGQIPHVIHDHKIAISRRHSTPLFNHRDRHARVERLKLVLCVLLPCSDSCARCSNRVRGDHGETCEECLHRVSARYRAVDVYVVVIEGATAHNHALVLRRGVCAHLSTNIRGTIPTTAVHKRRC